MSRSSSLISLLKARSASRLSRQHSFHRRQLCLEPLEDRDLLAALPTWTKIATSAASASTGESLSFTAEVAPLISSSGTPTGTVDFVDTVTDTTLGAANVQDGVAHFSTSALGAGFHAIIARYSGDSSFQPSTTAVGPASSIRPVAGNGSAGYSGDGGAATSAALNQPLAVAVAPDGSLYIGDSENHRVRRVDPANGMITTIAGTGTPGNSGDGGPATAAQLHDVTGLALDNAGNLYIADYWNSVVRRVNLSTGIIASVPGGLGGLYSSSPARIEGAQGLAMTSDGHLLAAAALDNVIYEIYGPATTNGLKERYAGSGSAGYDGDGGLAVSASLYFPTDVALDSAGNAYIADYLNSVVRRKDAATHRISTIAGNNVSGYSGDGGLAIDARLDSPSRIALDQAGHLFIADVSSNVVREVDLATGVITTIAGIGMRTPSGTGQAQDARLERPWDVDVDSDGNLYITTNGDNRVWQVTNGAAVAVYPLGSLSTPSIHLAVADATYSGSAAAPAITLQGNLSGADTTPSASLEGVAPVVTWYVGASASGNGSTQAPRAAGTYTAVASFPGSVHYSAVQSSPATFTIAKASPTLSVSSAGGVYSGMPIAATAVIAGVAPNDSTPHATLENVLPTFTYYVGASPTGVGTSQAPAAVGTYTVVASFAGSGNYLAAQSDPFTFTIDAAATAVETRTTIVSSSMHALPGDSVTFTVMVNALSGAGPPTGDVRIVDQSTSTTLGTVALVNGQASLTTAALALGSHIIVANYAGNALFAPSNTSHALIDLNATSTNLAGTGMPGFSGDGEAATAAQLYSPRDVAYDASGNLYIADAGNNRIRRIDHATGVITTVAGTGEAGESGDGGSALAAKLDYPCGVLIDAAGNLLIADTSNHRIRKVDAATGIITTIAGSGSGGFSGDGGQATSAELFYPRDLALDSQGRLFVADSGNRRIRKIVLSTGIITTVAGSGASGNSGDGGPATLAAFTYPDHVALDNRGHLFIAEQSYGVIRQVDLKTGTISNIAGTGKSGYSNDSGSATAARLALPDGLAVDQEGHLYVADGNNNVIRRIDEETGYIYTVARGFFTPMGIALDATGNLAVADLNSHRVKLVPATLQAGTVVDVALATPTVSLAVQSGIYSGLSWTASATVTGIDGQPAGSLEGVAPSIAWYAGDTATGTPLASPPATAGTYTALATFAGSARYAAAQSQPQTIVIERAQPLLMTSAASGFYTGAPFSATAQVAGVVAGIDSNPAPSLEGIAPSITYYQGAFGAGAPLAGAPTEPGTYSAIALFNGSANYLAAQSAPAAFTIATAGMLAPTLTLTASGGTYNGAAVAAGVTIAGADNIPGDSLEGIRPTVTYYRGSVANGLGTDIAPTAAGSYTVVATFAGSPGYFAAQASATFTIARAVPSIVAQAENATYDGSPIYASWTVAGVVAGVDDVPSLALDGVLPSLTYYAGTNVSGPGTSIAPTAAGTYTVVAAFPGSANYAFADSAPVTFTIAKATPLPQITSAPGGIYNGNPFAVQTVINFPGELPDDTTVTVTYYVGPTPTGIGTATPPIDAGTYTAIASYAGSANYLPAQSAPATFNIVKSTPTVTVFQGGGVYDGVHAHVSALIEFAGPLPEPVHGSFVYYVGTTPSGEPIFDTPVEVGTYTVIASFDGSPNYNTAVSAPYTFSITPAAPILSLAANNATYSGAAKPATALIHGVVAGWDDTPGPALEGVAPVVTYYVGVTPAGQGSLNAPTEAGTYTATAAFGGSANYLSATADPVTYTIAKATPTVTITDAGGPYTGQPAHVTGEVYFPGPTPDSTPITYAWYAGAGLGTPLASAPVEVGTYTVVATFTGSANYNAASSAPFTFTIDLVKSTPSIVAIRPNATYSGSAWPATAQLAFDGPPPANPAVTFTYYVGASPNGTGTTTAPINAGTYTVVASFAGSERYNPAASLPLVFIIAKAMPAMGITARNAYYGSSINPALGYVTGVVPGVDNYGQTRLENIGVTVTYYVGDTITGTALLDPPTAIGTYTALGRFAGSANYAATQNAKTYQIAKPLPSVALSAAAETLVLGQSTVLTATISGTTGLAAPQGSVSFYDWMTQTTLGTATLSGGSASLVVPGLAVGRHNVTVQYSGDGLYQPAKSIASGSSKIVTVAGQGIEGYSGDGGPALDARMYWPSGLTIDAAGNLYFADAHNNRIRKIEAATGIITTIAGNGSSGYNGDGIPATSASMNYPGGVVLDQMGHLYFADENNYRIRRVDLATGIITTIVGTGVQGSTGDGGQATQAQIMSPIGLGIDEQNNLYFADYVAFVVRKVNLTTGIITTVAGTGVTGSGGENVPATSAPLALPTYVAVGNGRLYVTEINKRIREVDLSTGLISTFYGAAGSQMTLDGSQRLYMSVTNGNVLQYIDLFSSESSKIAGWGYASPGYTEEGGLAFNAQMNSPVGVALDAAGNLYICENISQVIRRIFSGVDIVVLPTATTPISTHVTVTALADPATPLMFGQPVTVAATITSNLPSLAAIGGTVQFIDRSTQTDLGTYPVVQGIARFVTSNLAVGTHIIAATYSGDAHFAAAVSGVDVNSTMILAAGNGFGRLSGDGGLAVAAALYNPQAVAIDNAGRMFVADTANNVIRAINPTTGVITTVAGTGVSGFSGDGGPATAAKLASPYGVSVDNAGHLFIADTQNQRVRRVDLATGIITTVAGNGIYAFSGDGGAATAASLYYPWSVAVDSSGNLYIADQSNSRIRKVTASSGIITTVAGSSSSGFAGDGGPATSASLAGPQGVVLDQSGHLFIVDTSNRRVRKVDLATGIITTVAGGGYYVGAGRPAIYTRLEYPRGLVIDSAGNLFISDFRDETIFGYSYPVNPMVRRVDAQTGMLSVLAGQSSDGYAGDGGPASLVRFSRPMGLALDSNGNLFVADSTNNRIRELLSGARIVIQPAALTPATVSITASSANILAGDALAFTATVSPGAYTTLTPSGSIEFFDTDTRTSLGSAPVVNGIATLPSAALATGTHNVIALYSGDSHFQAATSAIDANSIVTTVAGNGGYYSSGGDHGLATNATLAQPTGVVSDGAGHLYVAESNANRVRAIDLATGIITTIAGNGLADYSGDGGPAVLAALNHPIGLALDGAGNLYIADASNYRVRRVHLATGIITTVAGNGRNGYSGDGGAATDARLAYVYSVAVDTAGKLYIGDNNYRVRVVDPNSRKIETVVGNGNYGYSGDGGPARDAQLSTPMGLALDGHGHLYIADADNQRVRRMDLATSIITTVVGGGTNPRGDGGPATSVSLALPVSVTFDRDGNLLLVDQSLIIDPEYYENNIFNNVLRKVDLATGVITTLAGTWNEGFGGDGGPAAAASLDIPWGVTVDSTGAIYIADTNNNRMRRIDGSSGIITTFAGGGQEDGFQATDVALHANAGMAADNFGRLYISNDQRVRRVDLATGVITTFAGTGVGGFSGDQGPAAAAQLNAPGTLAVDADYLYVQDTLNYRVRRISLATGVITTIAGNGASGFSGDGGPATSAALTTGALTLDGAGHLFVSADYRVRRIDLATGIITTVAGIGTQGYAGDLGPALAAQVNAGPIAADAQHLYVADYSAIRQVDLATGMISTTIGNSTGGARGDGGPAQIAGVITSGIVMTNGHLYIGDGDTRIRDVNLASGVITTAMGTGGRGNSPSGTPAGSALLTWPRTLAADSFGNLYVENYYRVQRIANGAQVVVHETGTGTIQLSRERVYNGIAGAWVAAATASNVPVGSALVYEVDDPRFEVRDGQLFLKPTQLVTEVAGSILPLRITAYDRVSQLALARTFQLTVDQGPADWPYAYQWRPNRFDVNADGLVTPIDALLVINRLNALGPGAFTSHAGGTQPPPFYDVSGDDFVSPLDALLVINYLNAGSSGEGEPADSAATAHDLALVDCLDAKDPLDPWVAAWWNIQDHNETHR
jgi:sugar lactone lactonase YvrE